jgi:hypothetical protein
MSLTEHAEKKEEEFDRIGIWCKGHGKHISHRDTEKKEE